MLVEQGGRRLSVAIEGANVHDIKLLAETIEAIVVERPDPDEVPPPLSRQGLPNPTGEAACNEARYIPHIRRTCDAVHARLPTRGGARIRARPPRGGEVRTPTRFAG